jgi:F-box protein 11
VANNPIAFMSYVHVDDEHENGRLTQFRERLSGEIGMQLGERFDIFQDRKDLRWGEQWKARLDGAIDAVTFLIPIVTPAFFKSQACRGELERFLEREQKLGRNDLIMPVYYLDAPSMNDAQKRDKDPLAALLATRQYADWRALRFDALTSAEVGKRLAGIARQIVEALEVRVAALPEVAPEVETREADSATESDGNPAGTQASATKATEQARGPEARTEVPTLIVDAFHRGDHLTINAALAAAAPGARILVRPGLYREGLVIDKPVEIIGDGNRGDIVIEAQDQDVVLFRSSMGRIANLTLRQAGGDKWYGVDITQGRLDLEDCAISSQSLAGIAIHDGADPRIRRNRIHDGASDGVIAYENGLGTLEDNEIVGHAQLGVAISEGAHVALHRNRIHGGRSFGVVVADTGRGLLEDNEIFDNVGSNVIIQDGGNPTLRRNRIHSGKASGVFICDNSKGTLENNDIFNNQMTGVEIKNGAQPALYLNRIHDNHASGVFFNTDGLGTIENNEIYGNALAGVEIKKGANPTLRRNHIRDGKGSGVFVHEHGGGVLEGNEIIGNTLSGVEIREGSNPILRKNLISKGKTNGLYVHKDGQGIIEKNQIVDNAHSGVVVLSGGNPTLHTNRITGNAQIGIDIRKDSGGTFENNDLRDNQEAAWKIAADARQDLKRTGNLE